jgi:hypothetical protein
MIFLSLVKLNSIHFDFDNAVVIRTHCVQGLGVWLNNKMYFHHQLIIYFLYLQSFLNSLTL